MPAGPWRATPPRGAATPPAQRGLRDQAGWWFPYQRRPFTRWLTPGPAPAGMPVAPTELFT
jgi:hypothetical protein